MKGRENHYIVAHRDDAFLTFGGHILKSISQNIPCSVHVIFNADGYIRPEFAKMVKERNPEFQKYKNDLKTYSQKSNISNILEEYLSKDLEKEENITIVGYLIRYLEEHAISKKVGFNLNEYNLPCGYPLRGYPKYNSDISERIDNDLQIMQEIILGKRGTSKIKKFLGPLQKIITDEIYPEKISFLETILDKQSKSQDIKYDLFFLSGIGSHPDHKIICECAKLIASSKTPNVRIFLGQDMPYATVLENFCFSNTNLLAIPKNLVDIKSVFNEKMHHIDNLYKSQISKDDIDVISSYHKFIFSILHKGYNRQFIEESAIEDMNTLIEVQYRL